MTYVSAEARRQLLDTLAEAIDELGTALARLGDAYEGLDEHSADQMEDELFKPVQAATARAKRTHAEFAARYGLPGRTFQPAMPGLPSTGVRGFLEQAADAVDEAEAILVELQDSGVAVEVGDPELRAGLAEIRTLAADVSERADRFISRFGR